MADIEKVKAGIYEMLIRCSWDDIDKERHRFQPVLNDVLELLKEQQPKLLTLKETINAKYPTDVFCEIKGEERIFAVTAPVPAQWIDKPDIRYWTARPTEEQRKAEPWKDSEQDE